jgi:hypothetical protein
MRRTLHLVMPAVNSLARTTWLNMNSAKTAMRPAHSLLPFHCARAVADSAMIRVIVAATAG